MIYIDKTKKPNKKTGKHQFFFKVVAKNGEPLMTSETYTRKENAYKGAEALRNVIDSVKNDKNSLEITDLTIKKG